MFKNTLAGMGIPIALSDNIGAWYVAFSPIAIIVINIYIFVQQSIAIGQDSWGIFLGVFGLVSIMGVSLPFMIARFNSNSEKLESDGFIASIIRKAVGDAFSFSEIWRTLVMYTIYVSAQLVILSLSYNYAYAELVLQDKGILLQYMSEAVYNLQYTDKQLLTQNLIFEDGATSPLGETVIFTKLDEAGTGFVEIEEFRYLLEQDTNRYMNFVMTFVLFFFGIAADFFAGKQIAQIVKDNYNKTAESSDENSEDDKGDKKKKQKKKKADEEEEEEDRDDGKGEINGVSRVDIDLFTGLEPSFEAGGVAKLVESLDDKQVNHVNELFAILEENLLESLAAVEEDSDEQDKILEGDPLDYVEAIQKKRSKWASVTRSIKIAASQLIRKNGRVKPLHDCDTTKLEPYMKQIADKTYSLCKSKGIPYSESMVKKYTRYSLALDTLAIILNYKAQK